MIKVIAKEGSMKAVLERMLPVLIGEDGNLTFVVLDQMDAEGVKAVKETKERPMIFCSFLNADMLESHGGNDVCSLLPLLYEAQCGFMRLPFELMQVAVIYKDLIDGKKKTNYKAIAEFDAKAKERLIGNIQHDMYPGKSDEARFRAMEKAEEELGITGTEEEVRKQLEVLYKEIKSGRFVENALAESEGVIAGVFCDVEGTIILIDRLIPGRMEMLAEYAKTGPVSLWTGGDVKEVGATLASLGVNYPLLSKYDYEGKTVEIAIDDRTEADIAKTYGIKAEQFVHVPIGG